MEKEFVTYEQALALSKLNYNGNYNYVFDIYKSLWNGSVRADGKEFIAAPLKQQVFRWFREKYGWYLDLGHSERVDFYYAILKNSEPFEWRNDYSTYEEAENACIDKLIEIAKQQDNENQTNN